MKRCLSQGVPSLVARRLAAAISVAVLVAMVGLVEAGPVLGAPPTPPPTGPTPTPTLNPGQQKKATPTPGPVVTPAPTPAPTPVTTPAPGATATPVSTTAPGGATATVTPRPGSGGTVGTPTPTPAPGATSPSGAGPSSSPGPTDAAVGAGSTSSGGMPAGDRSSVAVLLILVAVLGVLALVGGWFILGRRSTRDEEAPDAGLARPGATGSIDGGRGDGAGGGGGGGGGDRDTEPVAGPDGPPPTIAYSGTRLEDPLVAAMARSREPQTAGRQARVAAAPPPQPDDSTFSGPTWVNRLDPRIRVEPTLKSQPDRVRRSAKGGETGGTPEVDAAPNPA